MSGRLERGGAGDLADSEDFTISSATEPDLSEVTGPSPDHGGDRRRNRAHQSGDKRQMLHDLQVAKIELSQKTMALDNLRVESRAREEELQERLQDVLHQKQLLQARLESELHLQRDEARRRQEKVKAELEAAVAKQRTLEDANARLVDRGSDLKRVLQGDLRTEEASYTQLRASSESELTVREFVVMRIHEITRPLRQEIFDLREQLSGAQSTRQTSLEETDRVGALLDRERSLHATLQAEHQRVLTLLADTRAQVQHGDYKIENFDRVSEEREVLSGEVSELRERVTQLDSECSSLNKERDALSKDFAAAKQAQGLLQQDKDYLHKQVHELSVRCSHAEERLHTAHRQLDEAKQAREDLYEKYTSSREEYKSQYETKLREELDALRLRTDHEVDRLKASTREMYERENRGLRDERDAALAERDRLATEGKEQGDRIERLMGELSSARSAAESGCVAAGNEVRLRQLEADRAVMLVEEMRGRMREEQVEAEKVRAKCEAVTQQYYQLESSTSRRIAELETQLEETRSRLGTYERLERELDGAIMQAAELASTGENGAADRIMDAYGHGAQLPVEARRRMRHSVELAARVLSLEKRCRELTNKLEEKEREVQELRDEVARVDGILSEAQQPYGYLIEALKSRDAQLATNKRQEAELEARLAKAQKERLEIARVKNRMAADLERLLGQREELVLLRQLFEGMKAGQVPASGRGQNGIVMEKELPEWAQKLQKKRAEMRREDGGREYGVSYS